MPGNVLTPTDLADLVAGTLRELGRMKFQQIAQSLTHYEVFPKWFKKDKVQFDDGIGIQRTLMNRLSGAARHVGLLETDVANITDVVDQLHVDWVHAETSWAFIYQETLMNRGRSLIFNIIKPRRASAMIDLVEEIETKAWSCPNATNYTDPFGIPYWIVKNNSTGHYGGYPSNHTSIAGINLTRSPTFKNYTGLYGTVSKGDLIKKLRTAHRKCNFKTPMPGEDHDYGGNIQRFRCYVNEETISDIEDVGEAQNENLGRDIAPYGDNMAVLTFRGHPIIYIPQLDADSTNPFYGVDHSTFMPVCLKGDYLRETGPERAPLQRNVQCVYVDLSYNFLCIDRRRNWVLNQ